MIADVNPNQYVPTLGLLDTSAFRYANTIQPTNISHLYDAVKAASPMEQDKLKLLREELAFKREQLAFDKNKLKESARQKNLDFALDYAQFDIGYTKTKGQAGTYDLYGDDNIYAMTKAFQPLTNEINAAKSGMFSALNGDPFSFDIGTIDVYKNKINNLQASPVGQYFNRLNKSRLSILKGIDDGTNNKAAALAIQEGAEALNNIDPESETYLEELKKQTLILEGFANMNYDTDSGKEAFDGVVTNGINGVYDLRGKSVTVGNHDYLHTSYEATGGEEGGEPVLFTEDHPEVIAMANLIASDNRALLYAQNEILPGHTLVDDKYILTGEVNPEGSLALRKYLAGSMNGFSGEENITGVSKSTNKYRRELETKEDVNPTNDPNGDDGPPKPIKLDDILRFDTKDVPPALNDALLALNVELGYTREEVKDIYYYLMSGDEKFDVLTRETVMGAIDEAAKELGFTKPNWGLVGGGTQSSVDNENWPPVGGNTDAQETTTEGASAEESVKSVFPEKGDGAED